MIKPIVTYEVGAANNPQVLCQNTREVTDFKNQEVIDCVQDLNDSLDDLIKREGNKRGAIGLSATQIGVDLAITAVDLKNKRYVLINPKLKSENGNVRLFRIGCFSLYKYRAMVRYNDDVVVSYFDPSGKEKELPLKDDLSCVVQHEMDHLIGDLLFARLEHKEDDLFVPREALYKDGKIPLKNHGLLFEIRRRLNMIKVQSAPVFYSALFNDYTNYELYVDKYIADKKEFVDIISKYIGKGGLEVTTSTSALSIYFNKQNVKSDCLIIDNDMLDLAKRINKQNKTKVKYHFGQIDNLPFKDNEFETVFSSEILETLDDDKLAKAFAELLRVGKKLAFIVPTIKIKANTLKGNERLRSLSKWKNFLTNQKIKIVECKEIDNGSQAILVVSK